MFLIAYVNQRETLRYKLTDSPLFQIENVSSNHELIKTRQAENYNDFIYSQNGIL